MKQFFARKNTFLWGALVATVLLIATGFNWWGGYGFGWYPGGSVETLVQQASHKARNEAYGNICAETLLARPDADALLAVFKEKIDRYDLDDAFKAAKLEKLVTLPGESSTDRNLAIACTKEALRLNAVKVKAAAK